MGLSSLNIYRKKLTSLLTERIGKQKLSKLEHSKKNSIRKILIIRPNHRLGNQLLISPLIQELEEQFKNCKIDLFLKGGLCNILFKNYSSIDRKYLLPKDHFKNLIPYFHCWIRMSQKKYDLVINVAPNSSSGKLATHLSRGRFKIYGPHKDWYSESGTATSQHMAQIPVYHLRHFLNYPLLETPPCLKIKLDKNEIAAGKKNLEELFENKKRTIGIFTYATGDKCYSKDWWLLVYNGLLQQFGHKYNILEILPKENISNIEFRAVSFYSNNIREIASLIHNSEMFLAADSGIMHLGSATGTPVVGLFSKTNITQYGPYGNLSVPINTTSVDVSDILIKVENILCQLKNRPLD